MRSCICTRIIKLTPDPGLDLRINVERATTKWQVMRFRCILDIAMELNMVSLLSRARDKTRFFIKMSQDTWPLESYFNTVSGSDFFSLLKYCLMCAVVRAGTGRIDQAYKIVA